MPMKTPLIAILGLVVSCTVTNATSTNEPDSEAAPTALEAPKNKEVAAPTAAPIESTLATADATSTPVPPLENEWFKPNPKGADDGASCKKPDDCKSGVCEGEGCGGESKCAPPRRKCTRDLASFCGCDGTTFQNSGSCPGRPFKKRGPC